MISSICTKNKPLPQVQSQELTEQATGQQHWRSPGSASLLSLPPSPSLCVCAGRSPATGHFLRLQHGRSMVQAGQREGVYRGSSVELINSNPSNSGAVPWSNYCPSRCAPRWQTWSQGEAASGLGTPLQRLPSFGLGVSDNSGLGTEVRDS